MTLGRGQDYGQQPTQAGKDPERESKLLRMLKAEENDALGYRQTDLQQQQIDALKRYYGEKYGDEEDGRSQAVDRQVFESIEWTRPDLMRVFASGGNIIYLEETSDEDSQYAKDAADYLNWIFFADNPGYENLDDFAFDGLLHRRGFMACYWRDKEYRAPEYLSGIAFEDFLKLSADQSIEILAIHEEKESEAGGVCCTVRRTKSAARAEIVTVAPEDMRLNGRAVSIDRARYVGRVLRMLRGEIAAMWPEKAEAINAYSGSAVSGPQNIRRGSDVRMERFRDQSDDWQATGNNAAQEIEVLEEYLRTDLDDDGYPEMIRSYRMGDLLLEEGEVEENPFGSWTPIRIPHRFYGMSMHDITQDLQRRSTVLTRAALDATYQSVVNREAYDTTKIKDTTALTATYAGAKIPVQGDPNGALMQLSGGIDTAESAWNALNMLSAVLENRTGATRQTQGTDPDALLQGAHSGKAIDLLQTAGAARKEMMARNMGAGLSEFFSKLYRLVCRNQNQPVQIKVGGKACVFNPKDWDASKRVMIHSGTGTGNRDQTLMGLQIIAQFQTDLAEKLGVNNPMVMPKHIYRTFEEMVRAIGYRSADAFMAEPPEVPVTDQQGQPQTDPKTGQPAMKPWQPDPQPDPEQAKVQGQLQLAAGKQQADQQQAAAAHDLNTQKAAQDVQLAREKAQADIETERAKAQAQIDAMREKAMLDAQLARDQMALDAQLAREKMAQDFELERMRIESAERVGKAKAAATSDSGEAPTVDTDVNGQ